jgi:hypothetical protein
MDISEVKVSVTFDAKNLAHQDQGTLTSINVNIYKHQWTLS